MEEIEMVKHNTGRNILFCMNMTSRKDVFAQSFKNTLMMYQKEKGIPQDQQVQFDEIEMVSAKTDANKAIVSGQFDVVICRDKLEDGPIGIKCIEAWQEMQPNIRVILSVMDNKKGGNSMLKLFRRGYYDAVYQNDMMDMGVILNLLLNGRNENEAFSYYGIQNNMEYQKELAEKRQLEQEQDMYLRGHRSAVRSDIMEEAEIKSDEEVWRDAMLELNPAYQHSDMGELGKDDPGYNLGNQEKTAGFPAQHVEETYYDQKKATPDQQQMKEMNPLVGEPVDNGKALRESLINDLGNFFQEKQDKNVTRAPEIRKETGIIQQEEHRNQEKTVRSDIQPAKKKQDKSKNYVQAEDDVKTADYINKQGEEKRELREEPEKVEKKLPERVEGETQLIVKKVDQASVKPYEGYIITAISDQAVIVEVPGAHFMNKKEYLPNLPVTLVTPQIMEN